MDTPAAACELSTTRLSLSCAVSFSTSSSPSYSVATAILDCSIGSCASVAGDDPTVPSSSCAGDPDIELKPKRCANVAV